MFRRKLIGAFAATMVGVGLMSPVATAQTERVVAPEEQDAYVAEFHYDPNDPPVIDGVKGLTEEEIAEVQETIRQAEASGPPQDEIIPGEMWSDKVGVPEGFDKAEADQSEVAIAREQSQPQARTLMATAERCQSFWLIPYKVCGEILNRYEQLGGATSWLLLPIEHQASNPDGQGHRQRFVGGFIYSHPEVGTHAVANHTVDVWQRHGWEAGWLGYPLGGEVPVQGSNPVDGEINGWVQQFQGGRIYRTPVLEGYQVASINGLILDKWLEMGGPNSELGFPIADEAKTTDGIGRFSTFQNGTIYWHPTTGAHPVMAHTSVVWDRHGKETGWLGYPVADEVSLEETFSRKQSFQGGHVYVSPAGLASVGGAIYDAWGADGAEEGYLGFPITDEAVTNDGQGRFNRFENGSIYWHPSTGAHPVSWPIQSEWEESGGENGTYGYPVEKVEIDPQAKIATQKFQNGEIEVEYEHLYAPDFRAPSIVDFLLQGQQLTERSTMQPFQVTRPNGYCKIIIDEVHASHHRQSRSLNVEAATDCSPYPMQTIKNESLRIYEHRWWGGDELGRHRNSRGEEGNINHGQKRLSINAAANRCENGMSVWATLRSVVTDMEGKKETGKLDNFKTHGVQVNNDCNVD